MIRTMSRCWTQYGSIRPFDERTLNGKTPADKVDVVPAQGQELPTTGTCSGGQSEVQMKRRVANNELK